MQAREKHPHFEDKMFAMDILDTAAYTVLYCAVQAAAFTVLCTGGSSLYWTVQWRQQPILNCEVEAAPYTVLCSGGISLYWTVQRRQQPLLYCEVKAEAYSVLCSVRSSPYCTVQYQHLYYFAAEAAAPYCTVQRKHLYCTLQRRHQPMLYRAMEATAYTVRLYGSV